VRVRCDPDSAAQARAMARGGALLLLLLSLPPPPLAATATATAAAAATAAATAAACCRRLLRLLCGSAGQSFGFVGEDLALHRVTDDEVVECLKGHSLVFVFLNGCGTSALSRRVQLECGIPVVMGWDTASVPARQRLAMVGVFPCGVWCVGGGVSRGCDIV
jgi:hypothetical protein